MLNQVVSKTLTRPEGREYDVSPDGQRFLAFAERADVDAAATPLINVVLNWTQELLERVPIN